MYPEQLPLSWPPRHIIFSTFMSHTLCNTPIQHSSASSGTLYYRRVRSAYTSPVEGYVYVYMSMCVGGGLRVDPGWRKHDVIWSHRELILGVTQQVVLDGGGGVGMIRSCTRRITYICEKCFFVYLRDFYRCPEPHFLLHTLLLLHGIAVAPRYCFSFCVVVGDQRERKFSSECFG